MRYLTLIAAVAILSVSPSVFADSATPAKAAPLICPVTGEVIPSIKDAVGHSVYKGKTYYFCCPGCKPMFDADPAKYVKSSGKSKST